jgi:hypothetical protein
MRMWPISTKTAAHLRSIVPRALSGIEGLAGAGLIVYGAWLIYPPAGYFAAGVLLLVSGWLGARRIG